jgi:hypothetical protein
MLYPTATAQSASPADDIFHATASTRRTRVLRVMRERRLIQRRRRLDRRRRPGFFRVERPDQPAH